MQTVIDITDEDSGHGFGKGTMPSYAVIQDDMDILVCLGDVSLRMTYAQFDLFIEKANEWRETIPANSECDLTSD